MRKLVLIGALLGALTAADAALAHGNVSCTVPRSERRPSVDLQKQLKGEGWTVRRVQMWKGCYEVYGYDPSGKKVEAFFHPKTFERLKDD